MAGKSPSKTFSFGRAFRHSIIKSYFCFEFVQLNTIRAIRANLINYATHLPVNRFYPRNRFYQAVNHYGRSSPELPMG